MDDKPRMPTWREMNRDTSPEAEAVLRRLWQAAPPGKKWEMMCEMGGLARQMALAGLQRRYPAASPEGLQRKLADRILGVELAEKVYGPLPDEVRDDR